jgi:tRNA(fMet)-specific endonuclease VapC
VKYLLDTNVLSEVVRKTPSRAVLSKLERHQMHCCSSATVWNELLFGVARIPNGERKSLLAAYLASVKQWLTVYPYDQDAAEWHHLERARLEKSGRTVSFADGQIAAVAATRDLILVTANIKDFKRFSDITVASWW